jgi:hypothetical protein
MTHRSKTIMDLLFFLGFFIFGMLACICPRVRVLLLCCAMASVLAPEVFAGAMSKRGQLKSPS